MNLFSKARVEVRGVLTDSVTGATTEIREIETPTLGRWLSFLLRLVVRIRRWGQGG